MNTLAWIFILVALLILRGMTKGRSFTQIPDDLADMVTAIIASDTTALNEVLSRTGDATDPVSVSAAPVASAPAADAALTLKADKAGLVAFGKALQGMGYAVGEHPAFGTVHRVHVANSQHYVGEAIDVNADGMKGGEKAALDKANAMALKAGFKTIWQAPGHFDHLHVAVKR